MLKVRMRTDFESVSVTECSAKGGRFSGEVAVYGGGVSELMVINLLDFELNLLEGGALNMPRHDTISGLY